jgi:hypothetical protein
MLPLQSQSSRGVDQMGLLNTDSEHCQQKKGFVKLRLPYYLTQFTHRLADYRK